MSDPLAVTVRVIRCNETDFDPALKQPAEPEARKAFFVDLNNYLTHRGDEALIPELLREGAVPTYFIVRRLPMAYLTSVLDGVFPLAARYALAFRAAVQRVESPTDPLSAENLEPAQYGVQLAPEQWGQTVADLYGAEVVAEMGAVAIDLSRLPKGRRGPFSRWLGTVLSS